jgi:hypothetical protein
MEDLGIAHGFVVSNLAARLSLSRSIEILPRRDIASGAFRFR